MACSPSLIFFTGAFDIPANKRLDINRYELKIEVGPILSAGATSA
jgi:hypothetical protein